MDEQKIIFSNRFEKEKFEDYKTDLGTDSSVPPDFTEADDFLKFIQKNRRSVPSKERIADKDKFIKTVYELSNSFEIDADLIEFAEGYIANIYVDYACYTGYIKKLLAILFILADDLYHRILTSAGYSASSVEKYHYHSDCHRHIRGNLILIAGVLAILKCRNHGVPAKVAIIRNKVLVNDLFSFQAKRLPFLLSGMSPFTHLDKGV